MFKTVVNNDLIVLTKKDYLEIEILAKYEYPFVDVNIIDRKNIEEDGPVFLHFSSKDNSEMFERENNRTIFKLDTNKFDMPSADYHVIITGMDENNKREELLRFVISIRHGA